MGNVIITIGREFGSGGREIGRLAAEKLGFAFYDKELIAISASETKLDEKIIEELDETTSNRYFYARPGDNPPSTGENSVFNLSMNDRLFLIQSRFIREIADRESAVIVGRCADYVLRGRPDVIDVFIHAPMDFRVNRAVNKYGLNPAGAQRTIERNDESRRNYHNYYSNRKWGLASNYTLCIDSSIGLDTAVDIIVTAARSKMKNS